MATFHSTPVDDRIDSHVFVVEVQVEDGDDLIDLAAEDSQGTTTVRMTIAETLALIATLSEAVGAAVANRSE